MTITTTPVSDQVYTIYDLPLTFGFADWTEDINICGSFSYWQTLDDGSPSPTFVTLDSPTRTFSVSTSDPLMRGTY